jgi:ribonuclease HI
MTPLFSSDSFSASGRKKRKTSGFSKAEIYCDGACSGNPGESGIGVVIYFRNGREKDLMISEYIGQATNNIAEYSALIRGLEEAGSSGASAVSLYMDSELVVKQMKGEYKVKNPGLRQLWARAKELIERFEEFEISHIRREMNQEADALARKAVSSKTKL